MRRFAALAMLSFGAACSASPTATGAKPLTDAYLLKAVDGHTLPAHRDPGNSSRVLSGSLRLQPNGYFVLAESDSSWDDGGFIQEDYAEGGTWTADGTMLILSDTATDMNDTYGAAPSTYFGTIAPHTVLLTVATNDGSKPHVFQYDR